MTNRPTAALDGEPALPVLSGRACVVRYQPFSDVDGRREARALAAAGLDVTLVCLGRKGDPRHERVNGIDVRRFRLPKQRGGIGSYVLDYGLWFVVCLWWLTVQQLRRPFAVVQVSSLPDFQVFAAVVPKLMGSTLVLFLKEPAAELVESTDGPPALASLMRRVSGLAIRFADLTFAVTDQHRALYVDGGSDPNRIVVIENTPPPELLGVSRQDRVPSPADFVVLSHGTIEERYGHDTIVEAARILRDRSVGVRFVITGRGTWSEALEASVDRAGMRDTVDIRGYVDAAELGQLLARASLGVVAQHASPYSDVVHTQKMYEFFSLGIPVVASRLASTEAYFPDAIEFFEPGDPESLADRIEHLLRHPERRAELTANADRAYDDLSWPLLQRRYLGAIAALAVAKNRRSGR